MHEKAPYHDGTFGSWSKDASASHPYHMDDGVTFWVADVDHAPHDHWFGGAEHCDECRKEVSDHGDTP